jgi:hypothetical protein
VIAARSLARAGLLGMAFLAGCKVDQTAFDNRIFACDPSAKDPGCGSDFSGKAMVCYAASLLDGTDFCAADCGETSMSLPDGDVCVEGNAELRFCDPSGTDPAAACGQSDLGCLRTDVTSEEGVCTTMIPCTEDKDCKDPVRSTCAATFLKQLYSKNTTLEADHLYCLQKDCQSGASSCSPGQSCLPLLVPASAHAPDICVPNCDSQQNCPPNHVCFRKISGPANPAICIPGLLGFICESDINCLVGKCLSDGDPDQTTGLKLCTLACNSDADCAPYDSNQGTFACVTRSDGHGYCESPYSYRGNSCHTDDDCVRNGVRDTTSSCFFEAPPEKATDLGTCLRPSAGGDCAPRAGIGQTPLPFYPASGTAQTLACFPGFFGFPCGGNRNCAGDMTCRQAVSSVAASSICTTLCQTDADCNADRWTAGQSFCVPSGVCAPLLGGGKPCLSSDQCQSKSCQHSADGGATAAGTCAEPTP